MQIRVVKFLFKKPFGREKGESRSTSRAQGNREVCVSLPKSTLSFVIATCLRISENVPNSYSFTIEAC